MWCEGSRARWTPLQGCTEEHLPRCFAQDDRIGTVVADAAARSAAAARLPVMVLALPTPPCTKSAYGACSRHTKKSTVASSTSCTTSTISCPNRFTAGSGQKFQRTQPTTRQTTYPRSLRISGCRPRRATPRPMPRRRRPLGWHWRVGPRAVAY